MDGEVGEVVGAGWLVVDSGRVGGQESVDDVDGAGALESKVVGGAAGIARPLPLSLC